MDSVSKELALPVKVPLHVGGEVMEPSGGEYISREDPAKKNDLVANVAVASREDVGSAVDIAREAFDKNAGKWTTDYKLRERVLFRAGELIRGSVQRLAALESVSSGKTIRTSLRGDVPRSADLFEYYAGVAGKILGQTQFLSSGDLISIVKEPLGVIAAIVPWNFPLVIASRQVAPALAAGCTVVLKPATYTPITALELTKILYQAGLPKGVLNLVTGPGESTGAELVRSKNVDGVAFTGETGTGKWIMEKSASNLKRLILELGGKNPNVVFEDSDIEASSNGVVYGAYANNGETCAAGSRLLVHESIHERFVKALVEKVSRIRLGHPLDESSNMGPLVSEPQERKVLEYIETGQNEGGKILFGAKKPSGESYRHGYYVEPTLMDGITENMRLFKEEIFGPVLTITTFRDENEAVELANATPYGLAAGVWTRDTGKAIRTASKIRAGTVWINTYYVLPAENPWGGYKESGIGRGNSVLALEDYLEVKSIYFDSSSQTMKPYFRSVLE